MKKFQFCALNLEGINYKVLLSILNKRRVLTYVLVHIECLRRFFLLTSLKKIEQLSQLELTKFVFFLKKHLLSNYLIIENKWLNN